MSASDWLRVSRSRRCPVCGKPDWCLAARDGSAAICARTEQGAVRRCGEAGWLHRLRDSDDWHTRRRTRRATVRTQQEPTVNFAELAERYTAAVNPIDLIRLAESLGLSRDALWQLGVGWDGQAWTFPMKDAAGCIVGIRRRFPDGRKLSVRGGREGLFVPSELSDDGFLLLPEGPTDTAALLTLGFAVVGRPSCTGGMRLTRDLARGRRVVVVADADEAGQRGADGLASVLRLYCPSVRIIRPPDGVEDARAWVRGGATRADVQRAIDAADVLRVHVTAESHGRN